MPKYSELIKEEKENPQQVFNKTHKCPKCGHCSYEGWTKSTEGEFEDFYYSSGLDLVGNSKNATIIIKK